MDTDICLHSITAFDLLRRWDLAIPDLFDMPRATSLRTCRITSSLDIRDRLARLGLHEGPFHLMVGDKRYDHAVPDVVCHVSANPLPTRSLVRVAPGILCPSPELCFAQLAQLACAEGAGNPGRVYGRTFCRFPWLDEVDLALKGFELCGTYLFDPEGEDNIRNTERPLTSCVKMGSLLGAMSGRHGAKLARRALELVQDGSHSLMETSMALQLTGPRRIGGIGFERGVLNCKVETSVGDRYVDLAWRRKNIGLEYLGRKWHEDTVKDDRRRNKLAGSGMSIITVRIKDLSDPYLFEELVQDVADALGTRVRIRDREFSARRHALWEKTLPPLRRRC